VINKSGSSIDRGRCVLQQTRAAQRLRADHPGRGAARVDKTA
jgi:hypothetical protein